MSGQVRTEALAIKAKLRGVGIGGNYSAAVTSSGYGYINKLYNLQVPLSMKKKLTDGQWADMSYNDKKRILSGRRLLNEDEWLTVVYLNAMQLNKKAPLNESTVTAACVRAELISYGLLYPDLEERCLDQEEVDWVDLKATKTILMKKFFRAKKEVSEVTDPQAYKSAVKGKEATSNLLALGHDVTELDEDALKDLQSDLYKSLPDDFKKKDMDECLDNIGTLIDKAFNEDNACHNTLLALKLIEDSDDEILVYTSETDLKTYFKMVKRDKVDVPEEDWEECDEVDFANNANSPDPDYHYRAEEKQYDDPLTNIPEEIQNTVNGILERKPNIIDFVQLYGPYIPVMVEIIFNKTAHHYDTQEPYEKMMQALTLDNDLIDVLTNYQDVFHTAVHPFGIKSFYDYSNSMEEFENMPYPLKIRRNTASAGMAPITTSNAVLIMMGACSWYSDFLEHFQAHINRIANVSGVLRTTRRNNHVIARIYGEKGPKTNIRSALESVQILAPYMNAFINVYAAETPLANQKTLHKYFNNNPGLSVQFEALLTELLTKNFKTLSVKKFLKQDFTPDQDPNLVLRQQFMEKFFG